MFSAELIDGNMRRPSQPLSSSQPSRPRNPQRKGVISSHNDDLCREVADGILKAGDDARVIPCVISHRTSLRH